MAAMPVSQGSGAASNSFGYMGATGHGGGAPAATMTPHNFVSQDQLYHQQLLLQQQQQLAQLHQQQGGSAAAVGYGAQQQQMFGGAGQQEGRYAMEQGYPQVRIHLCVIIIC